MTILEEAVAAAGVDPRELHALLAAGQQARTIELARAFEEAGASAREAYERGRRAHAAVAGGFTNDGAPVLDAGNQSRQAWRLLGQGGQDMEDTARFLKRSVTALDEAQASSSGVLNRMITDLNAVASSMSRQPPADPVDAAAVRQQALEQAVTIVRTAAADIRTTIDTYDRGLIRDAAELTGRGYAAAVPAGPPDPGAPATYEGGVGDPSGVAPGVVPTVAPDQYRGLSGPNGLLTAGDVAGGLYGAKLETDAHFHSAYGKFLRDGATPEIARLRAQESVLSRPQFYRDLDFHTARLEQGTKLISGADDLAKTSKSLPLKVGGAMAVAGIGYDIATGKDPVQAIAAGGGGFLASVAMGAAVGTLIPVPGVGTAVGAIVGAGVGVFTSGFIDGMFEDGPDVSAAAARGVESVADTGKAIVGGVKAVGSGIAGLFD